MTVINSNSSNNAINIDSAAQKVIDFFSSHKIKLNFLQVAAGSRFSSYKFQAITPTANVANYKKYRWDLQLALRVEKVRIVVEDEQNKIFVVEIPNSTPSVVFSKPIFSGSEFLQQKGKLPFLLGQDVERNNVYADLADFPHLLIGGATGSGKSICLHNIIASLMSRYSPNEVQFLMIDFKYVEFSVYTNSPYLISKKPINDLSDALLAMQCLVDEMERRYALFSKSNTCNLHSYNKTVSSVEEKLPYIVVVFDEIFDYAVLCKKQFETILLQLAAKSRACGIHLILATQRPDTSVLTPSMRANIPARIAFIVPTSVDSKRLLGEYGAESLLGRGDMFFSKCGGDLRRLQCPYISIDEIIQLVNSKMDARVNVDLSIFDKLIKID